MKKIFAISLILLTLVQTSCGSSRPTSAVIPVDLLDEVTISNGDFDLTIYQVSIIESKKMGDQTISLKKSARDTFSFYEIRMRYTNLTDKEGKLGYQRLRVSLPIEEDIEDNLLFVGYCEPKSSNPKGGATFCAYVPTLKPGTYGVTGVYQATSLLIQPGEQAEFIFYIFLAKTQSEFVISFIEPE